SLFISCYDDYRDPHSLPTRRSSDLALLHRLEALDANGVLTAHGRALADIPLPPRLAHMVLKAGETGQALRAARIAALVTERSLRSEEHTSELQSRENLVCRLLLEKK